MILLSDGAAFVIHRAVVHGEATETAVIIAEQFLQFHNRAIKLVCNYECDIAQLVSELRFCVLNAAPSESM